MDSSTLENENLISSKVEKYQNLSKNYFEISTEVKYSFFDSIHEKLNYKFPQKDIKYNDYILPPKAIPFALIYDSSLLKEYESWLKNDSAVNTTSLNIYNLVKEYYFKWAIAKDYLEKIKNRDLVEEICDKNFDERIFMVCIFNALIDITESRTNSEIPNKLLKVQRIIENLKLEKELRNKISYLINIIFGIFYFRTKDYNYAKVKLTESLGFSYSGNTAKFYLAYIESKSGNLDSAFNYIKDIFYFDTERIIKSIDYNDLKQYLLYIKSAEFNSILTDNEFAELSDQLEMFFKEIEEKIKITAIHLIGLYERLKQLHLEEFYDDNIKNYFSFLESILLHFVNKNNFFFKISLQYLQQLFNKYIHQLINSVNNDYNKVVEKKLEVFDYEISENYEEIMRLQNNVEKEKLKKEEVIQSSIEILENEIIKTVADCKSELANIDKDEKYNFRKVFSNAMLYNTIISFLIIIIGGFVNLTKNPEVEKSNQLVDITQNAIKSGFQWGGAIFFFGCIIACVMAFMTIIKKSNVKNRLLKTISNQSQYKIVEIEKIREKKEKELELFNLKSNNKVEKHKQVIEQLLVDKKREEQILRESEKENIENFQNQLKEILSS